MASERGEPAVVAWPFVGRERLTAAMRESLHRADVDVVIVLGVAGSGKTRLCREVTSGLQATHRVVRIAASPSLRSIPLGALASLLPPDVLLAPAGGAGLLRAFDALRTEFGASPGTVVSIDDAAELDETSTALITQLVDGGVIRLVATHRSESTMSVGLAALSRRPSAVLFELEELTDDEAARLVNAMLGSASVELVYELVRRSGGNALFLVELIRAGTMSGALQLVDGRWAQIARLAAGAAVRDIVGRRLDELSPVARGVAETLALCQPVAEQRFGGSKGGAGLDELERMGLLAREQSGSMATVALAHPLFGETLVGQMTARRRVCVLREEIEFAERHAGLRPADLLRLALWRAEANDKPDVESLPAVMEHAIANRDYETVVVLAESANDHGVDDWAVERHLVDALYELGQFEESLAIARRPPINEHDPIEAAERAYLVARVLQWGYGNVGAALEVLDAASRSCPLAAIADSLIVATANVLSFSNRPLDALATLDGVQAPHLDRLAAGVRSSALLQTGQTAEAIEVLDMAPVDDRRGTLDLHRIIQALARIEHGDIDAGIDQAEAERRSLRGLAVPLDRVWSSLVTARGMLFAGRLNEAVQWATDVLETSQRSGVRAGQALALSLLAIAACQRGDVAGAKALVERQATIEGGTEIEGFLRSEWRLGEAWTLCRAGQPELGRRMIAAAAIDAADNGQTVTEAMLWHDHARLGGTPNAARLDELAMRSPSRLVAARALHVGALARRSPEALEAAAEALEAVGSHGSAAEAFVAAADAAAVDGDRRMAERLRLRAVASASRCDGAVIPGLEPAALAGPIGLSAREQDVVRLVLNGLSSKEIAEALFISTRTVDNHLQRIYGKVGVTGRRELRAALANYSI